MKRVLVVDDSKIALSVSRRLFESVGLEVTTIESAADFIEAVRKTTPDLVILDVDMPAVGGPKLVEIARKFRLLENIPVFFQSSRGEAELRNLVEEHAVAGFLPKSADHANTLDRVLGALGNTKDSRNLRPEPAVEAKLAPLPRQIETGLAWLDRHHRLLFDAVDRLDRQIHEGNEDEAAIECLRFLEAYAGFHFSAEARAMNEAGYPEANGHEVIHDLFRAKLREFGARVRSAPPRSGVSLELRDYLKQWIIAHVNESDRKFVQHLESNSC